MPFVLSQPREPRAGRGGFERETLAQGASETRFAAGLNGFAARFAGSQNLVESKKIGATARKAAALASSPTLVSIRVQRGSGRILSHFVKAMALNDVLRPRGGSSAAAG